MRKKNQLTEARFFGLSRGVGAWASAIILVIVAVAILAPLIAPYDPNEVAYDAQFALPSAAHLLGTDDLGRDLLSRLIFGARQSLVNVAIALIVYLSFGIGLGIIGGYVGGVVDTALIWLSDIAFSFPTIIVLLAVLAIFSNEPIAAMIMLGLVDSPRLARILRSGVVVVKQQQYVSAARVSGLNDWRIVTRHIMPGIRGPILVQGALFAGIALVFETGIGFLGLGVKPPDPSWGSMVADGARYLSKDPWLIVPSGSLIALTIICFVFIGDAIRDTVVRD